MKKMSLIAFLFFSWLVNAQQKEVQNSIETFFNAFHQKDTSEIRKLCSDKIILQSISESKSKGNKLSDENLKEFLLSIATIPIETKFKEKILNYTIQIDGSIAHVWAPYEFYLNDKLNHTGVNMFVLFKQNDFWKIIYLIDTRRK